MPVIQVTLLPGYSSAAEERIVNRLADAVRSVIAAPASGTTVSIYHASTYMRDGRVFRAGGSELADGRIVVQRFLDQMQQRDLASAKQWLSDDFCMTFPGGATMHALEELVQWARSRYARVSKVYEQFDQCWRGDSEVVYCFGYLEGQWLDGSEIRNVRFIDRFELVNGKIRRQDVWNDLAEAKQSKQE
jgi:phenylpyruvate tautomerase PptA (4-oxalocrotonate tautomerase family)